MTAGEWAGLQQDAGVAFMESLDKTDWVTATLTFRSAGGYSEAVAKAQMVDGSVSAVSVPAQSNMALFRLRKAMADPEHGVWLTATLKLDRTTGKVAMNVNFDYDNEPTWEIAPTPDTYIQDLQKHPRKADEVPAWYPR